MTFEEELNDARDEGLEKGLEKGLEQGLEQGMEKGKVLGGQMMLENINFAFDLFCEGKTDEEVFQSERFSSMEQVHEIRNLWKKP